MPGLPRPRIAGCREIGPRAHQGGVEDTEDLVSRGGPYGEIEVPEGGDLNPKEKTVVLKDCALNRQLALGSLLGTSAGLLLKIVP